jgi:hypothetical protein
MSMFKDNFYTFPGGFVSGCAFLTQVKNGFYVCILHLLPDFGKPLGLD